MPKRRFIDNTIICIKAKPITKVIFIWNSFHQHWRMEGIRDRRIPFLDVALIRKNDFFETTVYNIGTHWHPRPGTVEFKVNY